MIFDVPPLIAPAIAETQEAEPVARKRRRDRHQNRRSAAPYVLGAIVLLTNDDGSATPCQIVAIDANGTAWCVPVPR